MHSLRRVLRTAFGLRQRRGKVKPNGPRWEGSLEERRLMSAAPTVTRLVSIEESRVGPIRLAVATFSGPLNRVSQVSSRNYRFVLTGRDGVFGTRDDIPLPVTIGRRGPNSVFITPRATLSPRIPVLVCVRQGLRDRQGQLTDNNHDGLPGGDACVILRGDPIGARAAAFAASAGSGHWRSVRPIC